MVLRIGLQTALLISIAGAQWVQYPTPGVPRTPDGKPNLAAPAPRTSQGQPDLSGMWLPGNPAPCPKLLLDDAGECLEKTALAQQAYNIAAGMPGGLPYQPWAADLVKTRLKNPGRDDPHVRCMPSNPPRNFTLPHVTKIVQNPGLVIVLNEYNASFRQIFTDGRRLPNDPQPSWDGYSIGKWQGDTLAVETIGFRDDLWLDMQGNPLTSAGRVLERLRRPNFGTIELEITVDDPKAYTKPWSTVLNMHAVLDTELIEEICLEGEQSFQHMK
jgi:hypothetical protein